MAFYCFNSYEGDIGEYHWTPCTCSYEVVPYQASTTHSVPEFLESKFIEHYPTTYGDSYYPSTTNSDFEFNEPNFIEYFPTTYDSSTTHSVFEFPEPKFIEHFPTTNGDSYDPSITHSAFEFSEPKFIEHFPTTYGDSYDPSTTHSVFEFNEPKFIEHYPTNDPSTTHSGFEFHEPKFIDYYPTIHGDAYEYDSSKTHSVFENQEPKFIEHYPTTYGDAYEFGPSVSHSGFEFHEPKFIEYYPTNGDGYDPSITRFGIHYSTYNFSQPKVIQYEPTQYIISYSTSEFNEPDFIEYNPTPYGGGYDPTQTYGKPLPPSDEICYPRSTPEPNGLSFGGFSYGSIPSPYGNDGTDDDSEKPRNGSKLTEVRDRGQQSGGDSGDVNGHGSNVVEPLDSKQSEETEECTYGYDHPWSGFDYECGNGRIGSYGYECDKQVPQTPYGYGYGYGYGSSDAMDFCESIFGYWPCLSGKHRRCHGHQEIAEGSNRNPWKWAADYLFGTPFGHGEQRGKDGNYYYQ